MSPLEVKDPILGLLRFCRGCGEWWPKDDEFYYFDPKGKVLGRCRACWYERPRVNGVAQPFVSPLLPVTPYLSQ